MSSTCPLMPIDEDVEREFRSAMYERRRLQQEQAADEDEDVEDDERFEQE